METKIIAFYLPQFHAIPENDKAYGKDFTEWTNTSKARPQFDTHYQPRTPLHKNYYNLLDVNVMIHQAELAQKYGVYGFCYYHYWFGDGTKLLEKPIENMLKTPAVDIPFCLCWANENWSKRWDGGNNEIIMKQEYGDIQSWKNHIDYLLPFFKDERYIRVNDKPVFIVYKPELIPQLDDMLSFFQDEVKKAGLQGITVVSQYPNLIFGKQQKYDSIEYYIHFEPRYIEEFDRQTHFSDDQRKIESRKTAIKQWLVDHYLKWLLEIFWKLKDRRIVKTNKLKIRDYDKDWSKILSDENYVESDFPGAFVDWDNTPRNVKGLAYKNASPSKFEFYMKKLLRKVQGSPCEKIIFLNAWNEWAEGAYLEPDEKYGFAYLEALKSALDESKSVSDK